MRTHGHRAARIDPLDLIAREHVAALNPVRYGLADREKKYDVDGILWTKRVGEGIHEKRDMWSLDEIEGHLKSVYVGNIGYEVGCWFFFFFSFPRLLYLIRLCFFFVCRSTCIPRQERKGYGSPIYWNPKCYLHRWINHYFRSTMRNRKGYINCWRVVKFWITFCRSSSRI